jgi:hypothetical protein
MPAEQAEQSDCRSRSPGFKNNDGTLVGDISSRVLAGRQICRHKVQKPGKSLHARCCTAKARQAETRPVKLSWTKPPRWNQGTLSHPASLTYLLRSRHSLPCAIPQCRVADSLIDRWPSSFRLQLPLPRSSPQESGGEWSRSYRACQRIMSNLRKCSPNAMDE